MYHSWGVASIRHQGVMQKFLLYNPTSGHELGCSPLRHPGEQSMCAHMVGEPELLSAVHLKDVCRSPSRKV